MLAAARLLTLDAQSVGGKGSKPSPSIVALKCGSGEGKKRTPGKTCELDVPLRDR